MFIKEEDIQRIEAYRLYVIESSTLVNATNLEEVEKEVEKEVKRLGCDGVLILVREEIC